MRCIHENKINKISECNLLHDILNPFIRTKNLKSITLLFYIDV